MDPLEKIHYAILVLDGLANQWGDEAVFRRARDLLKESLKELKTANNERANDGPRDV